MLSLLATSATDAGNVRSSNQDRALIAEGLIAVADGMGGHAGGEIAAQVAVEGLASAFGDRSRDDGLLHAARVANRSVFDRAAEEQALRGMGTTLTAAALVGAPGREFVALVNVGDSRAYLLDGEEFLQLTEDHSLVEQMVQQGELTPDEAVVHPHRHILTRALGIDAEVEVDAYTVEARRGLRILLCSDGLTNEITEREIARVLAEFPDRAEAAAELVRRALAHGGNDNVTVVVADVVDDEPDAEPAAVVAGPVEITGPPRKSPRPRNVTRVPKPPRQRSGRPRAKRAPGERIVTVRVIGFVLVLLVVLGGIAGFTIWFNRATYYVGIDQGNVAIFEGRPGGFLWFQPTMVRRTALPVTSVLDADLQVLRAGLLESSYDSAQRVVNNLTNEQNLLGIAPVTTTTFQVPAPPTTVTVTTTTLAKPKATTTTATTTKTTG